MYYSSSKYLSYLNCIARGMKSPTMLTGWQLKLKLVVLC